MLALFIMIKKNRWVLAKILTRKDIDGLEIHYVMNGILYVPSVLKFDQGLFDQRRCQLFCNLDFPSPLAI